MFLGTFDNKIDQKGRVSIPAAFRDTLAHDQQFVMFCSFRLPCLEATTRSFMEQLKKNLNVYDLFSETHDDLTVMLFGEAHIFSWDKDGRIVLPEFMQQHAKIDGRAHFMGVGDVFQIWHPALLLAHKEAIKARNQGKLPTIPQKNFKSGGEPV